MMDTSKEYIEMCRKAVEVQELWVGQRGDLYVAHNETIIEHVDLATNACIKNYCDPWLEKTTVTWLPRQDQLQEIMLKEESRMEWLKTIVGRLHERFSYWYSVELESKSFEHLWLLFVMKEKFNKTWNRKCWE